MQWSPWQPWTTCDVRKCGNGLQTRKRTCLKKYTQRLAIGCTGIDKQSRACEVICPSSRTSINKDFLEKADIIKHVAIKYEEQARGWLNVHLPWLHSWLDTSGGRIGFAFLLIGLGIVIVLVSWICG